MRVCIDATPLLLRSAGVKTYVYHWCRHLMRLAGKNRVSLFPFLRDLGRFQHECSVVGFVPTWSRIAALQFANYISNRVLYPLGSRVDVFHASHQMWNPPRNTRLTATIYDMTCWLVPGMHSRANVEGAKRFAERVIRHADALIAISEHSRRDAIEILDLKPDRVKVIYPGVAEAYFDASAERGRRAALKRGISKPYMLFVGTIEPRKNVPVLLDAYQQLPPSVRDEFDLALVGSAGWGDPSLMARVQAGAGGVHYLGYVPESELPDLTAAASIFVYPSLYEGFGLPVAQAMAVGVPVVTSNVSSLPEVAGDAALLVDPKSAGEVAGALARLALAPELRSKLGTNGLRRSQQYRWEAGARSSWDLFESLC